MLCTFRGKGNHDRQGEAGNLVFPEVSIREICVNGTEYE